jgi:general secretion pathway protein E
MDTNPRNLTSSLAVDLTGPDPVAMVETILLRAVALNASDAHFEPSADGMAVRLRLDGLLHTVGQLDGGLAEAVVNRLKVMAGLLTYRTDIPQEGRIEIGDNDSGDVLERRLAVFPTINGQRAVVRFFYAHRELTRLDHLGLSEAILSDLQALAANNQGVLLITGPAGAGKSTTLAALIRHIVARSPGKSIISIEDPVEQRLADVTQIEITPHGELTFPVALRSILRQDPQVLMIGEIRDAETARIVIEAGLTGHLLMSTMHSGSPAAALLRLLEIGIEPYQITSGVLAILNQRLVRRTCVDCRGAGCDQCFQSGFRGRAVIAEMVRLDGAIRQAVLDRADRDELDRALRQRGHQDLRHDGQRLIAEGVTSQAEIDSVLGEC